MKNKTKREVVWNRVCVYMCVLAECMFVSFMVDRAAF